MCCESRLDVKILSLAVKNYQDKLDISRSLIRVVATSREDTFARCEK